MINNLWGKFVIVGIGYVGFGEVYGFMVYDVMV